MMQIHLMKLAILLFAFSLCEAGVLADESNKTEAQYKKDAAASDALRQKVAKNIGAILDGLKVSRVQKAKVKSLTSETQWKAAASAFKMTRGEEIHDHAHKLFPKTIPSLMQKFMPTYMRSKIMATRKKERLGPPSPADIA